MKYVLAAMLMMFVIHAFAESAADASNRTLAEMKSTCAKTSGPQCYQAIQANDAAFKQLMKQSFTDADARRQHQQEVIEDEQLRQSVRRHGY